jgi:signal transduction histidine kinase/ligand-binding sensor domain-containing protein
MRISLPGCAKVLALLALVSCCALPLAARAGSVPPPAINLHHTSWTARDGAPAMILSITQSRDGWLWLAGPTGLYRFDGMQFESFTPANAPLLTKNVSMVNAFADGSVWIGYRTGGAGLLRQGQIRNFDERDGLPKRAVWGIEQDGNGRIWAATSIGMYYLENQRWQAAASSWKLPSGSYKTLMRDRHGVFWTQGMAGVYRLKPGSTQFTKAAFDSGTGVLFTLPDGSAVSWDAARARFNPLTEERLDARVRLWEHLGDPTSLLIDRRGDLWVGLKEGLSYRTVHSVSGSKPPQGLSGPAVSALFEDREGNVWAATATGIDRFRRSRLSRIAVPESAIGAAIVADDHGGAWIGGFHVSADDATGVAKLTPLWPSRSDGWADLVTGFSRTSDGVLWGISYDALRRVQGRESQKVPLPAAFSGVTAQAVQADRDGSVLVTLGHHGLYRLKPNGAWEQAEDNGEVSVMARSDAAGLWLGYYSGLLIQAEGAKRRSYGPADGLNVGLLMALHLHGAHVWAGGDNGLALLDGGRFKQIGGINGENFDGISGIVELDNGDLWLNASAGLFRIPGAEIASAKRSPDYRVRYERLDQIDGLEGSAPRVTPSPSLVLSSDARLWVVRSTGVFRLNPAESLPPAPGYPIIIKTLGAPGKAWPAQADARFVAGSSAVQIDYTTASLAMPEKIRFRYRLEEVDSDWQEAGARRSAYYSNLASGDYHFRVSASDYSGQWMDDSTMVHFSIAPAVTDTWWFMALCAALLLSAIYLGYRWQINRMTRQLAGRLQERVSERERIARELHDTLLQSVQSLMLHLQAAVMKLPQKDSMRVQLETALQQADDVVDEGRERIRALRGDDADKLSFPDAILATASRLQPADACPIHFKMTGAARQLDALIYTEAMAIINEAMVNAYAHASAERIEVEVHYGARELRCIVRDNGAGIPADVLNQGGRDNHWGMRGMLERAERINAKLNLRSFEGGGTEWQLVVPAALAYTR